MNNILLETPTNFKSLKEYKQVLSKFKSVNPGQIKKGFMYSFSYDYSLDADYDVLRYYDSEPMSLVFTIKDSNHCFAINLHRIPLLTRSWLISRIKLSNPYQFSRNGCNKISVSYATLKALYRKVPWMTRQYRNDRMSNIKIIPNNQWSELSKYQAPTFHASTFAGVVKASNEFLKEELQFDFESFQSQDQNIINTLNEYHINTNPIF